MTCRIIKQYRVGDTRPSLLVQLWSDRNNSPEDIIGKSISFFLSNRFTGELVVDGGSVVIVDSAQAIIRYDFEDGDLDATGAYDASFVIDNGGSEQQTFPGLKLALSIEVN